MKKIHAFFLVVIFTAIMTGVIYCIFKVLNKSDSIFFTFIFVVIYSLFLRFLYKKKKERDSFKNPKYFPKAKGIYRVVKISNEKVLLVPWIEIFGGVGERLFSIKEYYYIYPIPRILVKEDEFFQVEYEKGEGFIFKKVKIDFFKKTFNILPTPFAVKPKEIED